MKVFCAFFLALFVCAAPAFANVTVYSPGANARVVSPFWLSAVANPCSSQPIAAMGYSFDDSSNTTIVNGASVSAVIGFSTGAHVLHIKSWGNQGASCVTNVNLTVVPPPTSMVPSWAGRATQVQTLGSWEAQNDAATGTGIAKGLMNLVGVPSLTGYAREFDTAFSNSSPSGCVITLGQNHSWAAWRASTRCSSISSASSSLRKKTALADAARGSPPYMARSASRLRVD